MKRCVAQLAMAAALLGVGAGMVPMAVAEMQHDHGSHTNPKCTDGSLACAMQVTPTFAPDGTLWLAYAANGTVSITHSSDLGRSFFLPVAVNPQPLDLDWGPDLRPSIAVDKDGRVFVAFARFKDHAFNGQVLYTRSTTAAAASHHPPPSPPMPKANVSKLWHSTPTVRCSPPGSTSAAASPPRRARKNTSVRD